MGNFKLIQNKMKISIKKDINYYIITKIVNFDKKFHILNVFN